MMLQNEILSYNGDATWSLHFCFQRSMFMKKAFLPLLLVCISASIFAAPEIKDFDIEGRKIGMNKDELEKQLDKICNASEYPAIKHEDYYDNEYSVLKYSSYTCNTINNIYMDIRIRDKVNYIRGDQVIEISRDIKKLGEDFYQEIIYKLSEKYGKPSIDLTSTNSSIYAKYANGSLITDSSACWGECEKGKDIYGNFIKLKNNGLLSSAVQYSSDQVRISRILYNLDINKKDENKYKDEINAAKDGMRKQSSSITKETIDNIKL